MADHLLRLLGEAVRFGIVGVINTIVTLFIIYILMSFGSDPYGSNALGYACGLMTSFVLNKNWTFARKSEPASKVMFLLFLTAFMISYLVNLLILHAFILSGFDKYLSQIFSMPFFTAAFFVLSKMMVFSNSDRATENCLPQKETS